jgi:hypothetical protein
MTNYDDSVLQQYADALYQQAESIVIWTALKYGCVTFVVCLGIGLAAAILNLVNQELVAELVFGTIFILLGIALGIDSGRRKAFHLKLEAQQALCQRQIEKNTRAMQSP